MSESTHRIDDPELTARVQARALEDKETLTLAEKLILASVSDQFEYTYKGVTIEVYAPTQKEFETILTLFNSVMTNASVPSGTSKEKRDEIEKGVESSIDKLFRLISSLCVDDSISFELLKSGQLGTSFIPKFVNEVTQREQELAQDITRFRKK